MTMVILLSFLGLEGQTSSLSKSYAMITSQLSFRERMQMTMVMLLSCLGLEGQTSSL